MKNFKFWLGWSMLMLMLYAGFFLLGVATTITALNHGVSFETPSLEYNVNWEGHEYSLTEK